MYCPYCGHDLPGHVGRFCGTCGISIQFLAPFLQNDPGSMSDELMEAGLIIRRLDPSGVQLRHRRRFIRRGYFTAGPNQVWHIDGTQFWIDLFNDLRERHLFNGSHEHKCLLRYVFLGILQKDLDEYRELWNNHTIRPVRQSSCHSGKPEAMYHLPHRFVFNPCNM
nr:uncharacterized protein LOC111860629 isoform X4 [Paramormyrops kingsleyae]